MDLFDFSKPLLREKIRGSQTGGYTAPSKESVYTDDLVVSRKKGKDYVKEYLEKEKSIPVEVEQPFDPLTGKYIPKRTGPSSLSQVDDLTSTGSVANLGDFVAARTLNDVYTRYKFDQKPPSNLLVSRHKETILDHVNSYRVTVIQGATGCGKTTQVPQFILNHFAAYREYCNIVVTQPRRIAALSVAHRVASERSCDVGTLVGYQVGQETKGKSEETRLLYCTTGVLLEKLINAKNLDDYTHIILDEVHERDQETDLLLVVIKKLMTRSPRTRIILMSATLEAQKLAHYFPIKIYNENRDCPVIDVGEKMNYDVKIFYLDDLKPCQTLFLQNDNPIEFHKPDIGRGMYELAIYLLKNFDHIEKNDLPNGLINPRGYVLVFLPGLLEIEQMHQMITNDETDRKLKWSVHVLHSSITIEEQDIAVKLSAPPGHRKIFLSTNIAESSLTMKDVKYVIDFCLTKQLRCETGTSFTHLQKVWASHSNCTQRAGRVGRTDSGKVYRLVPKEFYEVEMLPRLQPEICVNPLDRVVLKTKVLDMGPPIAILAAALDPPDLSNIEMTVATLKELGALLRTVGDEYKEDDGDLTFAGRLMATLPLDPRLSKLILLGFIFGCSDDCIKIACAMSNKSLFSNPFNRKYESYEARLLWANASTSDLIAILNAYTAWEKALDQKNFMHTGLGTPEENERRWLRDYFLQSHPLRATKILIMDVQKRLLHLDIVNTVNSKLNLNDYEKALVLKVAIAGAFYPQYFTRGCGNSIDEQEALKILFNNDPFSTVLLTGLPAEQPGVLYVSQIKDQLSKCCDKENMRVSFDKSSKVYVQFYNEFWKNPEKPIGKFFTTSKIPGKIHPSVYGALKLRQLKIPIKLDLLPVDEAMAKAKELGLVKEEKQCFGINFTEVKPKIENFIPEPSVKKIAVSVTHIDDPSHFWVVYNTPVMKKMLKVVTDLLNAPGNLGSPKNVIKGNMYAVRFHDDDSMCYYRARVMEAKPKSIKGKANFMYKVFFIDFGNTMEVSRDDVMEFTPKINQKLAEMKIDQTIEELPELAIQCSLSEIKPSQIRGGDWTKDATRRFIDLALNDHFMAHIYSIVYGIVSVELYRPVSLEKQTIGKTINNILIEEGFAEKCEESFQSMMDHFRRISLGENETSYAVDDTMSAPYHKLWEGPPEVKLDLSHNRRVRQAFLRGPVSPLEMRVHPISQGTRHASSNIDWNSVNSILLDAEPENSNDRLIVAGFVSTSENGEHLSLRETTLMPNIGGLVGILCLLFAPSAELRLNKYETKITGAVCGLGYDPITKRPYNPTNDIEVVFDAELDNNDIKIINSLRFYLNKLFQNMGGDEFRELLPKRTRVKELLLDLLTRRRYFQNLMPRAKAFTWAVCHPRG
ncbi:unnamed protein product [Bemisia tabaci]|uniref:Probable ATP-dependent RNA helicase spindle-E n=1 Tax=Bemisia tabaci TaxID=7038 RepID=A0A9P0F491_BEMTA|nr:unnamed protein product [Bemisia tabaci]